MKRLHTLIVLAFLMTGLAVAQPSGLMEPGATPENPFYFVDRASESMELAVAQAPVIGGAELEAKVRANHAEERLSEARKLMEQNKTEKAEKLMEEYSQEINRSIEASRNANNTELNQRLGNISNNHVKVLEDVKEKVPEQARGAIQRAIENSQKSRAKIGKPKNPGKAQQVPEKPGAGRPENPSDQAGEEIPGAGREKPDTGNITGGAEGKDIPAGKEANISGQNKTDLQDERTDNQRLDSGETVNNSIN